MGSHRYRYAPAVVALALCASSRAEAPPADGDAGANPGEIPVIVVTATRTARDPLDVPASVDVIRSEDLHDGQLRVNASETLDRIAGVVALNRHNYAQDLQVSIRGFGARSSFGVRGVRLYVDGVPATLPDGQGQLSNFPLNAADHIEVLRGPFSALYGNSSGGVIVLTTALDPGPTGGEASFAAGSDRITRASADLAGGTDSVVYALDGESFRTGGFRPHSTAERGILNLRVGLLHTPLGELRLSGNSLESPDALDPMGLTRQQLQVNPDQTTFEAIEFNTRKSTRQGTLGADLLSTLGTVRLETSAWWGDRSILQFQSIPLATQIPPVSPGGVIDLGRHFGGIDSRATVPAGIFTTTAGLDFERLVEDRFGFNNFTSPSSDPHPTSCATPGVSCGVLGSLRRDQTNSVNSIDPYAQTEARLGQDWRLLGGLRWSHVQFDSSDHLFAGAGSDISYVALNPTAGAVFRVTPTVSTYASYGRGFETPTLDELAYKPSGLPGLNTSLKAARSNNYELGAKTRKDSLLSASAAAFTIHTSDDIVVLSSSNGRSTYHNAASTHRNGLELEARANPSDDWTMAASYTLIDATFQSSFLTCAGTPCPTPTLRVAAGNHLPSVPERTFWGQVKYRGGWADVSIEAYVRSRLYVNDLNSDRAGGAGVFDAVLERTTSWGPLRPHFFARVDNLSGRRYVGSVIVNDSNGRFFEPAPTRTWLFGMDLPF